MTTLNKNAYYLNFDTTQFLGAKELLKSMPFFYNKVYFCMKYGNALWSGEKEEHFSNIAMICKEEDIAQLRQIIKNNFLHIAGWDSIKFTEQFDYGFSFIGGNIKFILMPFKELDNGYRIRSYDVDTGMCYETTLEKNKEFFLDTSINSQGEIVRTCDFNMEEISDSNSVKKIAEKKIQPEMAVYNNGGYTRKNIILGLIIFILALLIVFIAYSAIN